MIRQRYYGWYEPRFRKLLLSLSPPDAPTRPALFFDSRQAVRAFVERRKGRVMILWLPPLPTDVDHLLEA